MLNNPWFPALLALGVLVAFPILWIVVMYLIAQMSGWARLARIYPAAARPEGKRLGMQSIRLGWASYNNCLTITVSPEGLYLVPIVFFRLGHPPLLIPWREIRDVEPVQFLWTRGMRCRIGSPPLATLVLAPKVFESVKELAQPAQQGKLA